MMPWSEGWGTCVHPGRKSQNSCQDWQNMLKNSTKFFLLRGVHDGTFFGPSSALGECRLSLHAWIWTSFYEWRNQKMRNTKKTGLRTSQCVIPGPCYRPKKTMVSSQLLNRKISWKGVQRITRIRNYPLKIREIKIKNDTLKLSGMIVIPMIFISLLLIRRLRKSIINIIFFEERGHFKMFIWIPGHNNVL